MTAKKEEKNLKGKRELLDKGYHSVTVYLIV